MEIIQTFFPLSFAAAMLFPQDVSASLHREYPISSHVYTTQERTIVPDPIPSGAPHIYVSELSKYSKYGYGKWHYGPGLPYERRLDIMSSSYNGASTKEEKELLHYFAISDMHIRDKESPAQAVYLGYTNILPNTTLYTGTMLYTTQTLDATIRTINALHKKKSFDFGISQGDACHGTQYNELRWFIDVLDGKVITPSSGSHVGAHCIDYQKRYKAAGLHKKIHWYEAVGNADHFWQGYLIPDAYIRQTLIGRNILNLGNVFLDPLGAKSRGFYMGALNGKTPYGTVFGVGSVKNFTTPPKVFAADCNRHSLSMKNWIRQFFKTSSYPKGHGFTKASKKTGFACYTFEPKSEVPIKFIVLDDTQSNSSSSPLSGHYHGYLDQQRYQWLLAELEKGQAQEKLMVIVAHIPIGVEPPTPSAGWLDPVFEAHLVQKLHTFPNLLMVMGGHYHRNNVTALPSPDPLHPELGFLVVETASLRDFPQQFRTFRIVRNSDDTISLFVTNVDFAAKKISLAAKSGSYAIGAMQIFQNSVSYPPTGSYNAELLKPLSPEMQQSLRRR